MPINPYAKQYSEDFNSPDFAYFRRARIRLNNISEEGVPYETDPKHIDFVLTADNYLIYDSDRLGPTSLKDLYKGRDVIVDLFVDIDEPTAAPDIRSIRIGNNGDQIQVRILDMTYNSGLSKNVYYIDVYGAITEKDGKVYTHSVEYNEKEYDILIEGADALVYGNIASYVFDEVVYDGKDINTRFDDNKAVGKIGYKAGVGRLYVTFGNEYGGVQTHIIEIHYIDRTVKNLFEVNSNIVPYYKADGKGVYSFVFDPFKPYANDTQPLAEGVQGYLKNGSRGTVVEFNDGTTLDLSSSENISRANIEVLWDDSNVKMRFVGGNYKVIAEIGTGTTAAQKITYPVIIKSRKVKSGTGFENILKSGADTSLQVYDYLNEPNLNKAIEDKLFLPAGTYFRVYFDGYEDEYMEFRMGYYAGTPDGGKIVVRTYKGLGAERIETGKFELLEEEQAILMSFTIDPSKPISYKGGEMRFYITIPGFAMGEDGQQKATISVEIEEQYIAFIQEGEEDNYNPASAKPVTIKGKDEGAIQYTTGTPKGENIIEYTIEDINSYHINRPYYYIKQNGVPMPNYIWVYVTTKEWQEKINSGIATISFNDSTGNTEAYYYENGEVIHSAYSLLYRSVVSKGQRGR